MNLRLRLGLTTLAIVAPLALGAVWARRDMPRPPAGLRRGPPPLLPALAVLAVMQLALGPVVGRIRRLTGAVRRSAGEGYARPVAVEGDDEVADLARAFNDAADEVRGQVARQEQRERTLREFLENTTHDIAIPLTVLQGHLAALRQAVKRGEAVTAEAVGAAMDEAHYLASLTHNLTAAARLESAPGLERGPVELGGVVARAVARHRPSATQHGVAVESGVPPEPLWVDGDVTLIEQALSNAVHNAVRYNREGGHVAVLLEGDGPGGFRLRVIDDGPGMSADELAGLGRRRARGDDARARHPDGRGLGLDIARRVTEAHGWTMVLAPSEYGGLEVRFAGSTPDGT
ncbi:MAG: baeS [Myxococcaceae bacterium]|nr:baeS [Myxococcaceae bacterium]